MSFNLIWSIGHWGAWAIKAWGGGETKGKENYGKVCERINYDEKEAK